MPLPSGVTRFGDQLGSKAESKGSRRVEFMADGVVNITHTFNVDSGADLTSAAKPKDLDTFNSTYHARCVSSLIEPLGGNQSRITEQYQGYIYLPPTIYEFNNSRFDRPINMHPKFNDVTVFPEDTKVYRDVSEAGVIVGKTFDKFVDYVPGGDPNDARLRFRGIESYITGSSQFRRIMFLTAPVFDQGIVGKLCPPDSGTYSGLPDPYNVLHSWLCIENSCVNMLRGASIMWTLTTVWQYIKEGWSTDIYETAANGANVQFMDGSNGAQFS
jgi:hypothetical protein